MAHPEYVAKVHAAGNEVHVWTVNNPVEVETCAALERRRHHLGPATRGSAISSAPDGLICCRQDRKSNRRSDLPDSAMAAMVGSWNGIRGAMEAAQALVAESWTSAVLGDRGPQREGQRDSHAEPPWRPRARRGRCTDGGERAARQRAPPRSADPAMPAWCSRWRSGRTRCRLAVSDGGSATLPTLLHPPDTGARAAAASRSCVRSRASGACSRAPDGKHRLRRPRHG